MRPHAPTLGSVPSLNGFVNGILIVSCCFGKMKTEDEEERSGTGERVES